MAATRKSAQRVVRRRKRESDQHDSAELGRLRVSLEAQKELASLREHQRTRLHGRGRPLRPHRARAGRR